MFWFRNRYKLSPIDPRALNLTPEDVEAEFWACREIENPATEDYDDPDFEQTLRDISADVDGIDDWETLFDEQ